jgi:ribosomal protein L11 methyltransferase
VIRLAIRCRAEDAERVLAELLELAPGGIEEEQGEGWVEYAVYGPPGEIPELPEVAASAAAGPIEVSTTEIPDDWADRWRDFHKPILVGGRLCVRPSWEGGDSPEAAVDVVIDPGQAFGTGAHATTRMCLELLLELADEGHAAGPLVDLGTGSGVLAIAAAKLGWEPVSGYDSESAALEAAAENAAANGVALELSRANLRRERAPVAPTMVANLTAPLLSEVALRMAPGPPPERLVCSGLLADELDAVVAAFAAASLTPRATRLSGEWAAICFAAT